MNVSALLAHALSIARGLGACLIISACVYFGGLVCIPRRWEKAMGGGESPAMLGAALYVVVCWFGIAAGITLARLGIGFAGVVLLLAAIRYRGIVSALGRLALFTRAPLGWLSAFGLLYVLAYLFTMPPATSEYLPPAWTGNIDLMTYMRYTTHLLRLGPSNLQGFSYLDWVYLQTPAVFYFLGWLSLFFGRDPMSAVMPAQFALTALIGLFIARISRSVFRLSPTAAVVIAAVFVSGPFFRYVAGSYFLSTLMSTPVLLYLLWKTVSCRSPRLLDASAALHFGSAYVLLLFMYPFLLFVGVAAQAIAIVLMFLAEGQSGSGRPAWHDAARAAGRRTCTVLLPLGLLAIAFAQRLTWSIDMVRSLSKAGVAGWPLDIISPLALLGLPGPRPDYSQVADPAYRVWALGGFCAIALALAFLYRWRVHAETTPEQRTLVGLAGGAFLLYSAYFVLVGPSYQQWKFASYTALPLSFVMFAAGLRWLQQSGSFMRATRTALGRWVTTGVLGVVAVIFVGGNLAVHAVSDQPMVRLSGELRNLSAVDAMPSFRELAVQMDESNPFGAFLALYFLPNKRVHVISSQFEPSELLSFEQVSQLRPLLIQNYGCEGVGHAETMTVPGVGCLLFAPPSLTLDTSYPFNQSFLFVDFEGLGPREREGRWNSGSTVRITLTADLRRSWVSQDMYVSLRLNPYLPPGMTRQRLGLSWGAGRRAEISLSDHGWISLPVRRADWTGDRLWTLPMVIALRDGVMPPWMYAPQGRTAEQPLAALFEDLSIGNSPRGPVVAPSLTSTR